MEETQYMKRAIELAKKGRGFTNPNPLVGAVIVKDGRIIGEGYHKRYGDLHAERNAIAALTESAEGATMYVTLEPCCHYGKTPPCTEAVIKQKIAKVVIGSRDPNPLVAGKGIKILRENGVVVEEDFLKEACDALNPVFFHYMLTKQPYIIMKYAQTMDGKIALSTGASKWITGEAARERVHQIRACSMAIMTGIGTVLADDPMLTVRLEDGRVYRNPIRIICDSHLRIPLEAQLCKTAKEVPTIVVCLYGQSALKKKELSALGVEILEIESTTNHIPLKELSKQLGERGIDSILVEGGATLNEQLLSEGLVQEVDMFIGAKIFGGCGKTAIEGKEIENINQAYSFSLVDIRKIENDVELIYKKEEGSSYVHWDY